MWPIAKQHRARALACVLLWFALALPFARAKLEASMLLHMLVQLPLLACIGYGIGRAWLAVPSRGPTSRARDLMQSCNAGGCTGLIAASFVMLLWMLPRSLDLARLDAAVDAFKYLSVPAAGLAVALSWRLLPCIARAVVHLEVIASLLRFGWGYLAAQERLCLVYLAGDQQRTGELLLWLGAAYAIAVIWRPMFGASAVPRLPRRGSKRCLTSP